MVVLSAGKRGTRQSSRAGPSTTTMTETQPMTKPRLPKLAEVPSSRRQYTYGSTPEPPAVRPARNLRSNGALDLGNAVGTMLDRAEPEPEPEPPAQPTAREQMPPPPPPNQDFSDDIRSDRSFITESELYGDAAIVSNAPTSPPREPDDPRGTDIRRRLYGESAVLEPVSESDESDLPQLSPTEDPNALISPASSVDNISPVRPEPPSDDPVRNLHSSPRRGLLLGRSPEDPSRELIAKKQQPPPQPEVVVTEVETTGTASSLFRPMQRLAGRVVPKLRHDPPDLASNHSEADDAIQRDIEASELEFAGQQADEDSYRGQWLRVSPISPFRASRSRDRSSEAAQEDISYEHEADDDGAFSWWSLLSIHWYIDNLLYAMDRLNDGLVYTFNKATDLIDFKWSFQVLGIVALVGAIGSIVAQPGFQVTMRESFDSVSFEMPEAPSIHIPLPDVRGYASRFGKFASSMMPRFGCDDELGGLWELGEGAHEVQDYLKKYDHDFKLLTKAGKLHEASLEKLKQVVPKVVHMELKGGKPVVAPEFWYAMRDLLRSDDSILTVDEGKKGDVVLRPDHQWKAVAAKLASDPAFTAKFNLSMAGIEGRLNHKMTSFWDGWVKDNDDKIASTLGSALDRLKSAASERELADVVAKLVKEELQGQQSRGVVVTRDEFLRHLTNEVAVHRAEIRAELNELQPRVEELMTEVSRLAASQRDTASRPAGMSREDVTVLVNGLLRKALADTNLEALARGRINAHWDEELKNQINYMSKGSGAVVDPKLTSPTYDPYRKGLGWERTDKHGDDHARLLRGLPNAARPRPPATALLPWSDEGDCWCGARKTNRRGNPHGVTLSVILGQQIVPQHVVVEHILPGATVDPGARPRDMELYARIEDPARREAVAAYAAEHMPDLDPATEDWNATPADLGPRFVKIAQFRYAEAEAHDGVYVHRLSNALVGMQAETDQVVLRATGNYGADKHTCFYRVRLYGQRLGVD